MNGRRTPSVREGLMPKMVLVGGDCAVTRREGYYPVRASAEERAMTDYREWMKANGVVRFAAVPVDGIWASMDGKLWEADTEDDLHLRQFVPDIIGGPVMLDALLATWTRALHRARNENPRADHVIH